MKTLALYSIKGGVGKTAAAVNLSWLSSGPDSPVLLCDLDPQGASSYYFRVRASKKFTGEKFLRGHKKIYDNIRATDFENLDLLPSDFSFRNLDIELSEEKKPLRKLRKNLLEIGENYRHLIFDCPPNLTLLSESVFSASDIILVPVIPTTLSIRTYNQLTGFFESNGLESSKILAFFSMVEMKKKMHRDIVTELQGTPGFLRSMIPYSSDIEKMGIYRSPLTALRPASPSSKAYLALWEELRSRME
ncbi:MAG: ParA family protein [Chlorobiaceae bacterium]|nr:ParA family protein [Chlorobiaceae bacterium]NTV60870.1 ParA family protein [Chlorobiaceae bacterium]